MGGGKHVHFGLLQRIYSKQTAVAQLVVSIEFVWLLQDINSLHRALERNQRTILLACFMPLGDAFRHQYLNSMGFTYEVTSFWSLFLDIPCPANISFCTSSNFYKTSG